MTKKLPFLVLGYLLGALSLVASVAARTYTKASEGVAVTEANCKGGGI